MEYWDGAAWRPVTRVRKVPEVPAGSVCNEVRFNRVRAGKVRVVFTHAGCAGSGVSELLVWNE